MKFFVQVHIHLLLISAFQQRLGLCPVWKDTYKKKTLTFFFCQFGDLSHPLLLFDNHNNSVLFFIIWSPQSLKWLSFKYHTTERQNALINSFRWLLMGYGYWVSWRRNLITRKPAQERQSPTHRTSGRGYWYLWQDVASGMMISSFWLSLV